MGNLDELTASSAAAGPDTSDALPSSSATTEPALDTATLHSNTTPGTAPASSMAPPTAPSPAAVLPALTRQLEKRIPDEAVVERTQSTENTDEAEDTKGKQLSFQVWNDDDTGGEGTSGPATSETVADATSSSHFSTGLSVDSDTDSALGDTDLQSSTQSVRSSVYEFVEENGRTFHRYKQGKYLMPNDQSEQERLDLQHAIFLILLKGQLHRAPIRDPLRVLDLGTGTGIWAIEFANMYPAAQVIGTDLSPIQPTFVPPNCHFEIDDAEDDWSYGPKPFDLVHLRLLWHSFSDFKKVLRSAYDNLRPGGYIEWQDYMSRFRAVDNSLEGTALDRLAQLYAEGGKNLGRDMLVTPKIAGMMREVGFVDVVEERYALPGNPWPRGEEAKMLGLWQMTNFLEGMQAITMTVLTKGLGMTPTEVEMLLVEVRKDVRNTNVHFYTPVYIMYGRKPFPDEVN